MASQVVLGAVWRRVVLDPVPALERTPGSRRDESLVVSAMYSLSFLP